MPLRLENLAHLHDGLPPPHSNEHAHVFLDAVRRYDELPRIAPPQSHRVAGLEAIEADAPLRPFGCVERKDRLAFAATREHADPAAEIFREGRALEGIGLHER